MLPGLLRRIRLLLLLLSLRELVLMSQRQLVCRPRRLQLKGV